MRPKASEVRELALALDDADRATVAGALSVDRLMASGFVPILHSVLPRPCFNRPFVCAGQPESCRTILIGENPATSSAFDWWDFWSDEAGFDLERWEASYRSVRLSNGMREISATRSRIVRLRRAGVRCLETNVFMNERLHGHGDGRSNMDLLDLAMDALPDLNTIIAHGKVAHAYLDSRTIPRRFRIFRTRHFRLLSYAEVDALAAEVNAA